MAEDTSETSSGSQSSGQNLFLGLAGLVLGVLGGSGGMALGFYDRIFPENKSPTASLEVYPGSGEAPHRALLIASGSSDPEGGDLRFAWKINSDSMNASDPVIEHTFNEPGRYAVNVNVQDTANLTATTARVIEVKEAFDRNSFLQTVDGIEDRIELGDFVGAIDIANPVRYACGTRVPPQECAKIHRLAAEAHRNRGEFDHGVSAMKIAVSLHPDDVFYKVEMATHYLLIGRGDKAIEQLEPLLADQIGGTPVVYFAALARAMQSDYDKAIELLSPVRGRLGPYHQAVNFTHQVVDVLSSDAREFQEAGKVRTILCEEPKFKQVIASGKLFGNAHLQSLHVMVGQLTMQDHARLTSALENAACD